MSMSSLWRHRAHANVKPVQRYSLPNVYTAQSIDDLYPFGAAVSTWVLDHNSPSKGRQLVEEYRHEIVLQISQRIASGQLNLDAAAKWLGAEPRLKFTNIYGTNADEEENTEMRNRLNTWIGEHCSYCGTHHLKEEDIRAAARQCCERTRMK